MHTHLLCPNRIITSSEKPSLTSQAGSDAPLDCYRLCAPPIPAWRLLLLPHHRQALQGQGLAPVQVNSPTPQRIVGAQQWLLNECMGSQAWAPWPLSYLLPHRWGSQAREDGLTDMTCLLVQAQMVTLCS